MGVNEGSLQGIDRDDNGKLTNIVTLRYNSSACRVFYRGKTYSTKGKDFVLLGCGTLFIEYNTTQTVQYRRRRGTREESRKQAPDSEA